MAVLGIVIGQGHYGLALAGMLVMIVVLVLFDSLFSWVTPVVYRRMLVCGRRGDLGELTGAVGAVLSEHGISIQDYSGMVASGPEPFELEFHIRCRNHQQAPAVLERVCGLEGVASAEWRQLAH